MDNIIKVVEGELPIEELMELFLVQVFNLQISIEILEVLFLFRLVQN
jgi:hypothetical protein